ncbi:uncharacterized protein LOC121696990 [Alosa sapidissima]|uniref:uncharacterized protein LOC121696990 n=1 Tax=Alosa sapidissima TaxID=34773 RepID=UPI001C096D63|nr:uncharacterized protein LOC121696990 [Alosa sapidissima]
MASRSHRSIPYCGRKTKKNIHLNIATWNVRTLLDMPIASNRPCRRTALVALELARYNIDIAALSETRLHGEDSLTEVGAGYTFFWKGVPEGMRRIHGVGFAVKTKLLQQIPESPVGISERLMTWRIPLTKKRFATLISAYAPTLDADNNTKEDFYHRLDEVIQKVPAADKLLLMGDFNARVGNEHLIWKKVIGQHGVGKMNNNGHCLLSLCAEHELLITNSTFQMKKHCKTTWQHPRSKHWHLLDYIIVRQKDRQDVMITRAMRLAECWTDHRMVRSKLRLVIPPCCPKTAPKTRRLNIAALSNPDTIDDLRRHLACNLSHVPEEADAKDWPVLSAAIHSAASTALGTKVRKHQDWYDNNSSYIHLTLQEKQQAHKALLSNPQSFMLKDNYTKARAKAQLSAAGDSLLKDRQEILERWAEHFNGLLNHSNPADPNILDKAPVMPQMRHLDSPPDFGETSKAIRSLKNNKSPGPDGIPAEVFKHGGYLLTRRLHLLITKIWQSENVPQDWKDANIIILYKQKGDRADCGNSRGISLLSTAGKVLAKIMLSQLVEYISELTLPETQCGFRKCRSTTDMIFALRQLLEKSREQRRDLYITFIDLSKAFDTINHDMLWEQLAKLGVPPKFLSILQQLHDGMQARVVMGGLQSDPFKVNVGVKQGCVLATVLFNPLLTAITRLFHRALQHKDGIDLDTALMATSSTSGGSKLRQKHQPATSTSSSMQMTVLSWHTAQNPCSMPWTPSQHYSTLDSEIHHRINKASSAFGRLRKRVFGNNNLKISTKVAVYNAVCVTTLLYGAKTWTPYRRHINSLEMFHIRCLQKILNLSWEDRIPHTDILTATGRQTPPPNHQDIPAPSVEECAAPKSASIAT